MKTKQFCQISLLVLTFQIVTFLFFSLFFVFLVFAFLIFTVLYFCHLSLLCFTSFFVMIKTLRKSESSQETLRKLKIAQAACKTLYKILVSSKCGCFSGMNIPHKQRPRNCNLTLCKRTCLPILQQSNAVVVTVPVALTCQRLEG